jgi:hypothetical protein
MLEELDEPNNKYSSPSKKTSTKVKDLNLNLNSETKETDIDEMDRKYTR